MLSQILTTQCTNVHKAMVIGLSSTTRLVKFYVLCTNLHSSWYKRRLYHFPCKILTFSTGRRLLVIFLRPNFGNEIRLQMSVAYKQSPFVNGFDSFGHEVEMKSVYKWEILKIVPRRFCTEMGNTHRYSPICKPISFLKKACGRYKCGTFLGLKPSKS